MGAISDGLATFIDYIAEHVSPRIAGRWDVQWAWCNRHRVESPSRHILLRRCACVSTRAFANHFFSCIRFVGLRSLNKNKYHSTAKTYDYSADYFNDPYRYNSRDLNPIWILRSLWIMVAGAEGSRGAEWLHGHHRRYGDVYVNQGEEYALRLAANFLSIFSIFSIFWIFWIYKS